jgi:hypothetical protein
MLVREHHRKVPKIAGCAPIILSADATSKVTQGKDDSEYELRVVFLGQLLPLVGGNLTIARDTRARLWPCAFATRGTGL